MNVFCAIVSLSMLLLPKQQGVPYSKIGVAFEQKNPSQIISCAKEKILINIEGTEGAYSRSQAILVLKKFFNGLSVGVFTYTFKGTESEIGTFAIGTYHCERDSFRITMHFKGPNENYQIEHITIERN